MEPIPVASSPQGTPSEPTESRTGSTADLSELLAKHSSTVGNWASVVDEEAPVGEVESTAGVWMNTSARQSSDTYESKYSNNNREYAPPFRCYVSHINNRAQEADIVNLFGGRQKVTNIQMRREQKILDCELEFADHDALVHALSMGGTDFRGRTLRVEYIGQGSRKFSRTGAYPQQQGGFRRPPSQNDVRGGGGGRQQGGPFPRDGYQRQQRPAQQQRGRNIFAPKQEANDVRALQTGGAYVPAPRPSPQLHSPTALVEHRMSQPEQQQQEAPPAPAPQPAKPRVNPFGQAKPANNAGKMQEIDAKLRAQELEEKHKVAAAKAASTETAAEAPAGEKTVDSAKSQQGHLTAGSDVSRKTSTGSHTSSNPQDPAAGHYKKEAWQPQRIDSRRSTAERSDQSQSNHPPRTFERQRPHQHRGQQQQRGGHAQRGEWTAPRGGGGRRHDGRKGPQPPIEKSDESSRQEPIEPSADAVAPVTAQDSERRSSVTASNDGAQKPGHKTDKEPTAQEPVVNGTPAPVVDHSLEVKPCEVTVASRKPLTFTNSSRKGSSASSGSPAPRTPVADSKPEMPNGKPQPVSAEQPPPIEAAKATSAAAKKAAKKEKKAKAKETSVTSKNKFGALLDCDVYD